MFIVSQLRKKYMAEYRREAANLVIELQRPITHVARRTVFPPRILGRWVKLERERRVKSRDTDRNDVSRLRMGSIHETSQPVPSTNSAHLLSSQ
ncbi:transposase [Corynebacterium sp. HMSC05E07]|uniref:transposase n=1 Tax=Corynebacterium sp. HMSC05E07 TaxID=1581117 RepID=UPI0008D18E43|nr:hypothetical protein HMPREF3149_09040 [Corynebacterium sp. HMSC05E07]